MAEEVSVTTTRHGVRFDSNVEKAEHNQYWYTPHTVRALLDEVRHHATACAFLSTPSLYFALMDASASNDDGNNESSTSGEDGAAAQLRAKSRLFEYDRQWEMEPGFVHYDYHKPEHVPVQHLGAFDYVLADPPFITEDVWTAYVHTAKLLLRPGGKVLFTTVMENHTVLEGLLDAPLFIASFRPAIAHLTYQYVCFTNYGATRLAQANAELPPEDPKITAAIQMANDLRESEQAFTAQMRQRDRKGEQPLPAALHHQQQEQQNRSTMEETPVGNGNGNNAAAMADIPLSAMKWGYIPEGLTMYANGNDAPPAERSGSDGTDEYGDAYRGVVALRETLDAFKRHIDLAQKHLDQLLKLQQKRAKQDQGKMAELSATDAAFAAGREQLTATLESMRGFIVTAEASEARLADVCGETVLSYIAAMKECVEAYAKVEVRKQELSELAADATRKYKSPVFNRMKELLQRLKEIKKQHQQQQQQQKEEGQSTVACDAAAS
ncbi:hypothetical protein DQ04_10231000 [Trypanosoma grayi]|uniref:hypothetical protein n=1 Tax=Trypanosoma grayi TaxID=71804 RepID=UPI0004F40B52|nr:hypothetical protein DQ04_10231000 [Trypanosoma grayi]KEG07307.1 hypothetical protein DQ04_10231000 [Trypanosoma grayi]